MAFLIVKIHGGKELQRRNIDAPIVVGRSLDCDIWIDDKMLSRHHCKIDREGEGWAVEDMGSRNGTYLHGHRILRHELKDGDVIVAGDVRIIFHTGSLPPVRPSDPTAALGKEFRTSAPPRHAPPSKPLPTPKVSPGDTMIMPGAESKPLPFTRPPARPIVRPTEEEEDEA